MKEEDKKLAEEIILNFKSHESGIVNAMTFSGMFEKRSDKRLLIIKTLIDDYHFIDRVGTHAYRLTKEGWEFTSFNELEKIELEKNNREKIEIENIQSNTKLNRWLYKTKWLPLLLSFLALLLSIYFNYQDKNKQEELQLKIENNEKSIDTLKIENMNLRKQVINLNPKK
ncbi:hypothetical protein [Flavobacterium sp.]|uniref:hypothetical protein n=1 Tax=Flavobacterium sp. TaxID=239 RepID=UPI002609F77C|nr:hypothetical protein [Flavobacterium sp.]